MHKVDWYFVFRKNSNDGTQREKENGRKRERERSHQLSWKANQTITHTWLELAWLWTWIRGIVESHSDTKTPTSREVTYLPLCSVWCMYVCWSNCGEKTTDAHYTIYATKVKFGPES